MLSEARTGRIPDGGHGHRFLGAAYGTFFQVQRDQVRLVAGESHLRRHRSSPWAQRAFCDTCGSGLFGEPDGVAGVGITLASMSGPIDREPERHIFWDDRAPWRASRTISHASAGPRASSRCPDPRPGSSPARLVLQPEAARDRACATRVHHVRSEASLAVATRVAAAAITRMTADTRLCSRKTLAPRFETPPSSGRASPALATDGGAVHAWLTSALGAILLNQ